MEVKVLLVDDRIAERSSLPAALKKVLREDPFRSPWPTHWPKLSQVTFDIRTADQEYVDKLATTTDDDSFRHAVSEMLKHYGSPQVISLDLALNETDLLTLTKNGGMDLENPMSKEILQQITGYRLLTLVREIVGSQNAVVVTTRASNPIIAHECIKAGAHAFVRKPFDDRVIEEVLNEFLSSHLSLNKRRKKPSADFYVAAIAHEIVKGLCIKAFQSTASYCPGRVPFWAIAEPSHLSAENVENSSLLLLDVRGFSRLVELGKEKPGSVFKLMNLIWQEIGETLDRYGFQINNFIGDAVLAIGGVYGDDRKPTVEDGALTALEICDLFNLDGQLRQELGRAIDKQYSELRYQSALEGMKRHIEDSTFGVRVVVTFPDPGEALYGEIGTRARRHHTILSRFMNALARSEAAVSSWEKKRDHLRTPGVAYMLWRDNKPLPIIPGIRFLNPAEFLGAEPEPIRDVPSGLILHKVERGDS